MLTGGNVKEDGNLVALWVGYALAVTGLGFFC